MTEQQLRQELGEAIKSSGIPEGQTAFDLKQKIQIIAKAYADAQVDAKDAEIKRLREGIQKAIDDRENSVRIWSLKEFLPVLKGILSTAPVTESRHPISLQMYKCNNCQWRGQVGESIETETCDLCPECKAEDLFLYDEDEDQE